MTELWQLYDEQGNPIAGKGLSKDEVFGKGILHGASHVWIWRNTNNGIEVLLQRRAPTKLTWPNLLDISAAGHIDLGETATQAAVRETKEEIGLDIDESDLELIGRHRFNMTTESGAIENEFRWIYLLELKAESELSLQQSEVASTQWIHLDKLKQTFLPNNGEYVPQGNDYFELLLSSLVKK